MVVHCRKRATMTVVSPPWKDILRQPSRWYENSEARAIAANVLAFQHKNGGWEKNIDMTLPPQKPPQETTIDNGATTTQIRLLARVGTADCQRGVLRGLDYLLEAQYPNGGWPQFWPLKKGYYTHITLNDDAMVNVLEVLRATAAGKDEWQFVDAARRKRATDAVQRGVKCLLRCQITLKGRKCVWCAQHDEKTLVPAKARAYELPSLSGSESVGVLRFLMGEPPDKAISEAIEAGVAWLRGAAISGIRVETQNGDRIVVHQKAVPLLWARFYDLDTEKPFFCGRDGIKKATLAEIEKERRMGYAYYGTWPQTLLDTDYPRWKEKG